MTIIDSSRVAAVSSGYRRHLSKSFCSRSSNVHESTQQRERDPAKLTLPLSPQRPPIQTTCEDVICDLEAHIPDYGNSSYSYTITQARQQLKDVRILEWATECLDYLNPSVCPSNAMPSMSHRDIGQAREWVYSASKRKPTPVCSRRPTA